MAKLFSADKLRHRARCCCMLLACAALQLSTLAMTPAVSRVPAPVPGADIAPVLLLVDANSGQTLASKNDQHRFMPASVTKVMTLYLAFELISDGKLSPDRQLSMTEASQAEWYGKGSTMFIRPGQQVSVEDTLTGIATISANDASIALAEAVGGSTDRWVLMMNAEASKLGMRDSHFGTPNGWPDGGQTFTTARDLEKLGRALIARHPKQYAHYFGRDGMAFNGIAQANHDPISRSVKGADGIKTGYTREAGFTFLGSAQRDGKRLVMVLAGLDDYEDRGTVARQLMEWGFANFETKRLYAKGAMIGNASVQDGASRSVPLQAAQDIVLSYPRQQDRTTRLIVRYQGPVRAPIKAGDTIAQLVVEIEGMEPVSFPLSAARSVRPASVAQRIGYGFESWFS